MPQDAIDDFLRSDNMQDLIKRNLDDVKLYCENHNLDFNKLLKHPSSLDEETNTLYILHYDEEKGRLELAGKIDPEPCPCVLVIMEAPVGLIFEQTEYTDQYLSLSASVV